MEGAYQTKLLTTRGFLGVIDGVSGGVRGFPGVSGTALMVAGVKNLGKNVKSVCESGVSAARAILL